MPTSLVHQSKTDKHFTPPWVLEKVRLHFGSDFVDPCSSKQVNNWSVKADIFFDSAGIERLISLCLENPVLKVWCNPPSTYPGECFKWLSTLHGLWLQGYIDQFYFLFFNRENVGKPLEDMGYIPRVDFGDRLKYWSFNEITDQFQEGNWSIQGQNKNIPREVYTIVRGDPGEWVGRMPDGSGAGKFSSQRDAINAARSNGWAWRVWTNSPTQQSSLFYFPPRTNSGWAVGQGFFEEIWENCPIQHTIVRTRMPQGLGAK